MKKYNVFLFFILILNIVMPFAYSQNNESSIKNDLESLKKYNENLEHRLDMLEKEIDDVLWFKRVGDVAFIDKIFMTGAPDGRCRIVG